MSSCMHRILLYRALCKAAGAAGGTKVTNSAQAWDGVWKVLLLSTHNSAQLYSSAVNSCLCSKDSLLSPDKNEALEKVASDEQPFGAKESHKEATMDSVATCSWEGKAKRPREFVSPIRPTGPKKKSKGAQQCAEDPPLICLDDIPLPKDATTATNKVSSFDFIPLPVSPPLDQPPLPPPLPTPPPPPCHSELEEALNDFIVIDTRPSETLFPVPLPPHLSVGDDSLPKVSDNARTRKSENVVHCVESDPEEISVLYNSDSVLRERFRNINLIDKSKNSAVNTSRQSDNTDEINVVFEGRWPWVIKSPRRPQGTSRVTPSLIQSRNLHHSTTDPSSHTAGELSEPDVVTLDGEPSPSTSSVDSPKKSSSSQEKQFLRKRFAPDSQVRNCHHSTKHGLKTIERSPEPVLISAEAPSEPDIITLDTQACSILHPSTAEDFISLDTNANKLISDEQGIPSFISLSKKEKKLKKLQKKKKEEEQEHKDQEANEEKEVVRNLSRSLSPDIQKVSVIDPDVVELDSNFPSTSSSVPVNYDIIDVCEDESEISLEDGQLDVNLANESMDVVDVCDSENERESSGGISDHEAQSLDINTGDYLVLQKVRLENLENNQIDLEDEVLEKRDELESLRKWYMTNLGEELLVTGRQKKKGTVFSVMSYNVLAQQLLLDNNYLYKDCDERHLDWGYRWALLQHEIEDLDPDVLLLQEVQASHYFSHFLPWLTFRGYEGLYKKRTGSKCDGCAIFFKKNKFSLVEHCTVEYLQPQSRQVLDRDNIGIIAKLTPTANPGASEVCLATTHFLYNPRRHDVKLAQAVLLLTELDRICYKGEKNGETQYCPIILTGDFNAEPHTAVLDMMKNGRLRYEGMSSRTLTQYGSSHPILGQELIPRSLGITDRCQHAVLAQSRFVEKTRGALFSLSDKRKIEESLIRICNSDRDQRRLKDMTGGGSSGPPPSGWYSHDFKFRSVYRHYVNRAPEATTYHNRWTSVDYIFYSRIYSRELGKPIEGPLKLLGRYSLLSGPQATNFAPMPSAVCPSDHFPLAAQFLLRE